MIAPISSSATSFACPSGRASSASVSSWTRARWRSESTAAAISTGRSAVHDLLDPPGAGVHVHAARQARVERAHRAHDVDALEVLRAVLLEDRRVLHGVLVGAGRAVDVARVGVPRRRRVGLVVGDLALADDHVVREHAARRLVEADADRLLGHLEVRPALRPPGADLGERLLQAVQPDERRVGLVVGARAVALDRVRLLGHLPLELHLGHARRSSAAPSGCCGRSP